MSGRTRVCVVGSGVRFLSGISCYTLRLSNALGHPYDVSAILMRQLLPSRLYPGRARVGQPLTRLRFESTVRVFDGVDWFWLPSIVGAIHFLLRERPEVVVFQWWTGAVLHSYLALALLARCLGARVMVELHEVQDTGEARLAVARAYVQLLAPALMRLASGFVLHSEYDRPIVERRFAIGGRPVALIPHGPYDHYRADQSETLRVAPASACNLLFFGVIRPFKGLEDLVRAFDGLGSEEVEGYWLTVVGETWEGWTLPGRLIAASRHRDRITFVNRYVADREVAGHFAGADVVVLPYHRSSASGPLHVAMSHGLPVVVASVGGLVEAVAGYEGAIPVPPRQPDSLRRALRRARELRGTRFADPHSWERTVRSYQTLIEQTREARRPLLGPVEPGAAR